MYHSKLLSVLKVLDESELKRLGKFLRSPFHNANPRIVACYQLLRKYHPEFDSPRLTKEKVFKKLFPQKAYAHQKMLNLMSDFTALVEKFLVLLQLEKEPLAEEKMLVRVYAERKEGYAAFVKKYQSLRKNLAESAVCDASFFYQKFKLDQLYFNHSGTDKFKLKAEQYTDSMRDLDQAYLLEKLLLGCELKAREIPLAEQHDLWMPKALLAKEMENLLTLPIARAYTEMLQLLASRKEEDYFQLKQSFQNHLPNFSYPQKQNILASLLNYAIQKGNAGAQLYVRENLELYQIGIEQRLLIQHGQLNDRIYTNIALLAAKLGEFGWCRQFLTEHENSLASALRSDAKVYCLAYLCYGEGLADQAIQYLRSTKFVNDYYQLGARVLLLRIYTEAYPQDLGLYELLMAQCKALGKYLRRNNSFSRSRIKANLDFVSLLRMIIKLLNEPNVDVFVRENLHAKIKRKAPAYSTWLLQQLERL